MSHQIEKTQGEIESVFYGWRFNGRENFLKVTVNGQAQPVIDNSLQEFITEHYWGYARQRDGSTKEYFVEHPRWKIWETKKAELDCDLTGVYGESFAKFLNHAPSSAFLADGSQVKVYAGVRL
jgi:uncharacterized protein